MRRSALAAVFTVPLTTWAAAQEQFVPRTPPALLASALTEAVAADLDGDGDVEVFGWASLLAGGPGRRLLRNDGGERFTDVTATALPAQAPAFLSLGKVLAFDMDQDGDIDLLSTAVGVVNLWRNTGSGIFTDASAGLPASSGGFTDLLAADLDHDGDIDVAVTGQPLAGSANGVFVNQGAGTFTAPTVLPNAWTNAIAGADLDGDGALDLLLGSTNGLIVLRNQGGLSFVDVTATWAPNVTPGTVRDVVAGDVDGDGDADVVVCRQGQPTDTVLRNNGTALVPLAVLATGANGTSRLRLADVDEDGDLDLWRGGIFGVNLTTNDGLGGFTLAPGRVAPVVAQTPAFEVADVDDDGDVDLLVGEPFTPGTMFVNRHRDLRPGQPALGQTWNVEVWSQPGYAAMPHVSRLAIALAALPQPLAVSGFGLLRLDLDLGYLFVTGVVPATSAQVTFPFFVPNASGLVGLPLHLQALIEQAPAPARFTAWFPVVVQ